MEPLCLPKVGRDINMLFALKNKGVGKNCGGLLRNRQKFKQVKNAAKIPTKINQLNFARICQDFSKKIQILKTIRKHHHQ